MDLGLLILLLTAAILPSIVLMVLVYKMDKIEKEPIGLIARVFFVGAGFGLVASVVELVFFETLDALFPPSVLLIVIEYFICVAVVEELSKYLALNTIRTNPEFNYVFDGIVYAVAAALGFATLENIAYVLEGGFEVAAMRAVLSVPGHCADGVVMGVFFGLARQREVAGNYSGARNYYWLAFILPVIEHGFYDSALSIGNDLYTVLAIVVDLGFIILAGVLVYRTSKGDSPIYPVNPVAARQNAEFDMNMQFIPSAPNMNAVAKPVSPAPGMQVNGMPVQPMQGMSTMPGMPMMPNLPGFSGAPYGPGAAEVQGMPLGQAGQQMPYYQQPMAGQPPQPFQQPMAGQPQQPFQQPVAGQQPIAGQQPMAGGQPQQQPFQQPVPGGQPVTGQQPAAPMPDQQPAPQPAPDQPQPQQEQPSIPGQQPEAQPSVTDEPRTTGLAEPQDQ